MTRNKLTKYWVMLLIFNCLVTTSLLAKGRVSNAEVNNKRKPAASRGDKQGRDRVIKSNAEWKQILTPEQYRVMREKRTERPYENAYCSLRDPGTYLCVACNNKIFSADRKFDSGTGWPSFSEPVKNSVRIIPDNSIPWEPRLEVLCRRCEGHLGHVFDDGPPPTGLRYCLNSVALKFVKEAEQPKNDKSGQSLPRSNSAVGKRAVRNFKK